MRRLEAGDLKGQQPKLPTEPSFRGCNRLIEPVKALEKLVSYN